jgi:hypothetical protein
MDTDREPTTDQLQRIAVFIAARQNDEVEAVGGMRYWQGQGVTIQAGIPRSLDSEDGTQFVTQWVDDHSPARWSSMVSTLGWAMQDLARRAVSDLSTGQPARAVMAWGDLLRAAQLWSDHEDFLPEWASKE